MYIWKTHQIWKQHSRHTSSISRWGVKNGPIILTGELNTIATERAFCSKIYSHSSFLPQKINPIFCPHTFKKYVLEFLLSHSYLLSEFCMSPTKSYTFPKSSLKRYICHDWSTLLPLPPPWIQNNSFCGSTDAAAAAAAFSPF